MKTLPKGWLCVIGLVGALALGCSSGSEEEDEGPVPVLEDEGVAKQGLVYQCELTPYWYFGRVRYQQTCAWVETSEGLPARSCRTGRCI